MLARIDELGVDQLLCLGDLVGYYADPNDVVELISRRPARVIAGNHDRTAIGAREPDYFSADAKRAIEWTRAALSGTTRAFLAALPTSLSVDGMILLTHGAAHPIPNEDVRLNSEQAVAASFEVLRRDFPRIHACFFGHVHRPVVYELSRGIVYRHEQISLEIKGDSVYLINPGSVGQPRDGDARSSFCVFDTELSTVQFHRVSFDVASCRRKARRAGLENDTSIPRRALRFGRKCLRAMHDRLKARIDH